MIRAKMWAPSLCQGAAGHQSTAPGKEESAWSPQAAGMFAQVESVTWWRKAQWPVALPTPRGPPLPPPPTA